MDALDPEMTAWVLGGLDDIPWRARRSARPGADATAVPNLIAALVATARTPADYQRISAMLEKEVIHPGGLVDSAPYVIPFMARWMLVAESEDARATAIGIIDSIGDQDEDDPDDSGTPEDREILREALIDALDAVYDVLTEATGRSRLIALRLAYGIDGMTPRLEKAMAAAETSGADEELKRRIETIRRDGRGGHIVRRLEQSGSTPDPT